MTDNGAAMQADEFHQELYALSILRETTLPYIALIMTPYRLVEAAEALDEAGRLLCDSTPRAWQAVASSSSRWQDCRPAAREQQALVY